MWVRRWCQHSPLDGSSQCFVVNGTRTRRPLLKEHRNGRGKKMHFRSRVIIPQAIKKFTCNASVKINYNWWVSNQDKACLAGDRKLCSRLCSSLQDRACWGQCWRGRPQILLFHEGLSHSRRPISYRYGYKERVEIQNQWTRGTLEMLVHMLT